MNKYRIRVSGLGVFDQTAHSREEALSRVGRKVRGIMARKRIAGQLPTMCVIGTGFMSAEELRVGMSAEEYALRSRGE